MNYLIAQTPPSVLEMIFRLVLAGVLGAVVGFERLRRFKVAGLRTHIFACFAAALFMMISKYAFADLAVDTLGVRGADSARIAAGVVSGISFLCAGVIIRVGGSVHGINTAVGIWLTAAIGLATGAGVYGLAVGAAVMVVVFQGLLPALTIANDNYTYNSVKVTATNQFDFDTFVKRIGEENKGIIEDITGSHGRSESTYSFTIKTHASIETQYWRKYLDNDDEIISISHEIMIKS